MASVSTMFGRAVDWHQEAGSHLHAVRSALQVWPGDGIADGESAERQCELAARIRVAAREVTPGWLGCRLVESAFDLPAGVDVEPGRPVSVRVGEARLLPDETFPVVLPLLGVGNVAVDLDVRDAPVAGLLRGLLLRLAAAVPDGLLRVLPVDCATLGAVFAPFSPLVEAEVWTRTAVDAEGLRAVLAQAQAQVEAVAGGADPAGLPYLLVACAALPVEVGLRERAALAGLAHAGPAARVHLLLAGWPPPRPAYSTDQPERLRHTTQLHAGEGGFRVLDPPGVARFGDGANGSGVPAPVMLDAGPDDRLIAAVCQRLAGTARSLSRTDFAALMPAQLWTGSSAHGLRAVIGRDGRVPFAVALDDATPHLMVGGRTGSGKTVFLLDLLYVLASDYSPDEVAFYLLDFKEGVSFAEFTPTAVDPSWIPHARTVGIESDREYGLAVLRHLSREMTRRATELKRAGVTKLADLRTTRPDVAMPRLLVVVDEFQVLLTGNDQVARQAVTLLEELARKGRSYGIHLVLASQTISGIEALFTKTESIFGQFPLRVALAGGGGILGVLNDAADHLPQGTAVVNTAGGVVDANRLVRFPDADTASVTAQRHRLWQARPPEAGAPAVFAGYAEHHLDDDPVYARLDQAARRRQVLVGRVIDVGLPAAGFTLDATPGRHLAVLGTSPVGADVLHAAVLSLAQQHRPGTVRFVLAGLVPVADPACDHATAMLTAAGHPCQVISTPAELRVGLAELTAGMAAGRSNTASTSTCLVVFGADAASPLLASMDPDTSRFGTEDLRILLRRGPAHGIHLDEPT